MTSVQEKIQDAAARNAQLLEGLHETDSAPSQLYQQINYLKDLDTQIRKTEKHVEDLKRQTASELKEHKKYSESTFRRFAHKASGRKERFEEKAAKEEREYFDAIQEQKTAEDQLAYVRQLKTEAEISKQEYETQAQRHDSLQRELDSLYNAIFSGHTPGLPDEDAKESACTAAKQHVQQVSQTLELERHVLFLLRQMSNKLQDARAHLCDAHDASQMDMFVGGTFTSMQKRNYLERAESSVAQVRMLQDQIRQLKPDIGDIGPMNIASGSIWGDVIFDNIFTDMDMHGKIKDSEAQVNRAATRLAQQVRDGEGRVKAVEADWRTASEQLQERRKELQQAREDAFTRVANGETIDTNAGAPPPEPLPNAASQDAPPAYSQN
ncbi:hypothetical protein CC78DRAFT_535831 [Lojkania enalia]|uniref:Uncharacterized protein n=1 Tax=Lojkania enalia TaxID=147567 RepID=A0A9P4N3X6_9PLEO|nr:hypothetical protein CC78DRAFT_535831 [Didymosphaeria enalia]